MLLGKVLEHEYSTDLNQIVNQNLNKRLSSDFSYGPLNASNIAATEFGNRTEMGMCKIGV